MKRRPVWITGVGVVSAAGVGTDPLRRLLLAGDSGVRVVPGFDGRPAGRAPPMTADTHTRRLDRTAAMFFAAATEAWCDAGLARDAPQPERCAVLEGSSLGPLADVLDHHARGAPPYRVRPSDIIRFMTGAGSSTVARALGIRGPVHHLSAGSVSSMVAIGEACQMIRSGRADVVIVGGGESPLHPLIADHFEAAGILAARDGDAPGCRPFDRRRSGTVLGEGAGALVLESDVHARRRGALARAYVRGVGFAHETASMTTPDAAGAGVTASVRRAMREVTLREIGWVKAHGTGTRSNDAAEARGLAGVFGDRMRSALLTSLKPTLGHTLGASSAVEAVAATLALEDGIVPRTVGTEQIDDALPPIAVALTTESCSAAVALLLAEGFGGRCAAIALERA